MIELRYILFLILISSLAYIIPDMWIELRNPVGASVLLLTNAICMTTYALLYHGEEYSSPSNEKLWKMTLSGMFYFIAWLIYIEIMKYEKFAFTAASQTIIMFILSGVFAMVYLENKYNCTKLFSFLIGLCAIGLFAYGDTLESYPVY
jgi:glucose uptake protein GlcU